MSNYIRQLHVNSLIELLLHAVLVISLGSIQSVCAGPAAKMDNPDSDGDILDKEIEVLKGQENRNVRGISTEDNPHWDETKCNICHLSEVKTGNPALRDNEADASCIACHEEDVVHKYIHPVGMSLSAPYITRIKNNWNDQLPLNDKSKLTCITCHDPLNQCLPKKTYTKKINPKFLRDGPYSKRTDICYKCHDTSKYEQLNPHEQIAKDGLLRLNKCRLCHVIKKKGRVKNGIERDLSQYPLIKNFDSDRKLLCLRCHKKVDHPTSAFRVVSTNKYRHLVKITEEKKQILDAMKSKNSVVMPLEPGTDRIYCGTCHEAHQPGVFSGELTTSMKGTNYRLRESNICTYCHDK